jgi:hypothetical protein
VQAIEHAQKVFAWYETLPEEEIPPNWMWPLDHEVETWFLEVKRARETRSNMAPGDSDEESGELMENEFAARFRD